MVVVLVPDTDRHVPDAHSELWRKNSTLALLIGVMGLILLAQWVNNIVGRIWFPYPIEYIEDAIFFQALRVSEGLPLFMHPNDGYAAVIYTPGYFYILGTLFKIFGPSIVTARIISLICTLGISGLIVGISIKRLRFPLSIVPICIYLTLPYAYFAGYQDLGRVDSLMVLMIFAGLYLCGVGKPGMWRIFGGVILLTLACYVKQPALAYLYFVYIYLFIRYKTTGFIAILISFSLLLGIYFIGNHLTGGWFGFYTWELPMTHKYDWGVLGTVFVGGWAHAIRVQGMIPLMLAMVIYIGCRIFTVRREGLNIFEATLPGALIATLGPFMKEGGHHQDLIPLLTHLCFLLPYALSIPLFYRNSVEAKARTKGMHLFTSAILFFLMLHCVFSITPWADFKPKPDDVRMRRDFVHEIGKIDGEVLMPSMGYYKWLAGGEQDYLGVALMDLLEVNIKPLPLIRDVESGRYAAICLPIYFNAEGYWQAQLVDIGYSQPTRIIMAPNQVYDLCPTLELPPNKVYWRAWE